jgi:gamma-D-glutamyl-L-lysine dipeptidyl-peptidase
MNLKICELSAISVRKDAKEDSLLTSQLLFGEIVSVLTEIKSWSYVTILKDKHEGWVLSAQLSPLVETIAETHLQPSYSIDLAHLLNNGTDDIPIVIGSTFYQFDGMSCRQGGKQFFYNGSIFNPRHIHPSVSIALKLANKYLHAPYLFGGKTPFGIDASALIQMVFQIMGIQLPRFHFEQVNFGTQVEFYADTQAGDVAFFDDERGIICHVGLLLGDSQIMHTHDRVRIDPIDMYGIPDPSSKKYMYKLRIIKRFLPNLPKTNSAINPEHADQTGQVSIFQ